MILVTGASGNNGSAVVREFARQSKPVKALVRSFDKAAKLSQLPSVQLVDGDMLRPETLGPALDEVDRVLLISSANPQMVETQQTFIDACKKAGVKHIVKFSGAESNIGFNSLNFRFTRMHGEIERYLEKSGLAWTHLRPSQFMQVYLRESRSISATGALSLPLEDVKLSPIDIEDIAKIAFGVLTGNGHDRQSYDMTGPEALNMTEIAERISEAIGKPVRYVRISAETRRNALLASGVPASFADAMDEQLNERLKCRQSRVNLTTHELFNIKPTTFVEFSRRHADVFRG
jgi:uncharacterized protein YbjT (DUF2867 family)